MVSWWSLLGLQRCWAGWSLVQVWEPSRPVTCKHSAAEKHFQTWNIWKTAAARHPNMYVLAKLSCKYSVIVPLGTSYVLHEGNGGPSTQWSYLATLHALCCSIRKLCDLNCLGQKWQNCRAHRSCSLNLARVTGTLGQYRNKGPAVVPRTDRYAVMIWRGQSCGEVAPFIVRVRGLPLLCLKWMKVTVKDVSLISSCFHCNKLGLVALADCTVISPVRWKTWTCRWAFWGRIAYWVWGMQTIISGLRR